MSCVKRMCFCVLAAALLIVAFPLPKAQAADNQNTISYVEDLGNGITVETTVTVYPGLTRNYSTSAVSVSQFKNNGVWIATVSLKAFFTYNHITAGVTGTEYAKSLASGWSYTNHKITTEAKSAYLCIWTLFQLPAIGNILHFPQCSRTEKFMAAVPWTTKVLR